jgi:pre-mRNA-processing factor 39
MQETAIEGSGDVNMDTIDLDTDDGENQFELPQANENNEDNGSSNFAFDDNLTFEQQSNEKEQLNQANERVEQEAFIADLAEENANSFPSACDDNSVEKSMDIKNDDYINDQNDVVSVQDSVDNDDYQMVDEQSMDKTEDTFAQSEDLKVVDQQATDLDAENISEDELPMPLKPKVQDAEEVSDEELPGPKMAELPADTEVVSEEELPAATNVNKKDGKRKLDDYDPSEPTDENDSPEKKLKKGDSDDDNDGEKY